MNRKVNLCTNSPFLEDKMLREYSYMFFPDEQHHIIEAEEDTLKLFLDLNERELIPYLKYVEPELSLEDCYDVRVSPQGEYLRVRKDGKIITDSNEIRELSRKQLLLS